MRNILVLENVSDLDANFSEYLDIYHAKHNVNIIYNLSNEHRSQEKHEQLYKGLAKADELVVCSTFYNNEQFDKILAMLLNFKNIKIVRVLYSYADGGNQKFINFLNEQNEETKQALIALTKQCVIFEICSSTYELETEKDAYFKKIKYTFDLVPIYYNKKHEVFWHERQPVVPTLNSFLYLDNKDVTIPHAELNRLHEEIDGIKKKLKNKSVFVIDKKYNNAFIELLNETKAFIEYQIESCEIKDFGDSKKLIKEKQNWLKILENIKQI